MPKINLNDYGSTRPKLDLSRITGQDAVLTIASVEQVNVEDKSKPNGVRPSIVLTFREFPDSKEGANDAPAWWPNKTMLATIVENLGDNTDKWIDEPMPVTKGKVRNPQTGKIQDTIFAIEEWEEGLKAASRAAKGKRR